MSLSALDKNQFNKAFLEIYKLKLTAKPQHILPDEGQLVELANPVNQSLIGSIGPMRDPLFDGPQPPNSMGMVVLVTPDQHGQVKCVLNGRFDIIHRYIPGIDLMKSELLYDGSKPRPNQAIVQCFKRYTVVFEGAEFEFTVKDELSVWKQSTQNVLDQKFEEINGRLSLDPRIFRNGNLTKAGMPKIEIAWSEEIDSQDQLNFAVRDAAFAKEASEILHYQVDLRARIRQAPSSLTSVTNAHLLELYIVNVTEVTYAKTFGVQTPHLLDCELTVEITSGQHHLLPHKLKPEDYKHYEHDGLAGYGITCAIEQISNGMLRTNSMPVIPQWDFETPSPDDVGMCREPDFNGLATNPTPILAELLQALDRYSDQWNAKIAALEDNGQHAEAVVARKEAKQFADETSRVRKGCALLEHSPPLLKTFRWMNEVMGGAIKRQGKNFAGWRLFQLGFILTQIEAIYERLSPDAVVEPSWVKVDLLWFATGGGKTEAYLGIICMAMLYQRINHRTYGTTAWLRFPLRMLSVQQFQRLSYVVAQANMLRQRENLGGHPFTIGYFTGGGTPSQISSTSEYYQDYFLPNMTKESLERLKFISDCPYCDQKHSVEIKSDEARFRIKHVCKNPECWSNTQADKGSYGEGILGEIGIYVSDEECYRYIPTVLVGTIDKLAVIGHNKRFSKFFGASRFFCPEHGFSKEGSCEHSRLDKNQLGDPITVKCGNNTRTSAVKTVSLPPMLDPGFPFCIQDELHLLKETLGNFDGHYETLLQVLQELHGGRSPKILAATATIKDFEHHVHHLYQKEAIRYPAPGIQHGESFYSRRKYAPDGTTPLVRRYFSSLLPISQKSPVVRSISEASSRFLDLVDELRIYFQNDPHYAASLLNIDPSKSASAQEHLENQMNSNLIYVNQKRSIPEIARFLEEANIKRGTVRGYLRLDGESTLEQIHDAIEHIDRKLPDDQKRQMIATSVVSHGVDIERLNFMLLAGWPTSTAEYIQSSARSGRVHPGIVITVLSHMKLFEYNVFLNFGDYHQFLDSMVESVPINRFAPNILERTLPGVMSAVILNWAACQAWGSSVKGGMKDIHRVLNEKDNPARKEIEKAVLKALHIDETKGREWFDKRVLDEFTQQVKEQVKRGLNQLETWSGSRMDMYLSEALGRIYSYGPLRSFRDIENQIAIQPANEPTEHLIDALGR
ncbi:MAG: helicase C-terminal domain-containing protein [Geobacteraceae bacterium]|nr:helicase C-terminal domain-containing protein [Geobacteraceae bacterium]